MPSELQLYKTRTASIGISKTFGLFSYNDDQRCRRHCDHSKLIAKTSRQETLQLRKGSTRIKGTPTLHSHCSCCDGLARLIGCLALVHHWTLGDRAGDLKNAGTILADGNSEFSGGVKKNVLFVPGKIIMKSFRRSVLQFL